MGQLMLIELGAGVEPTTSELKVLRSTTELPQLFILERYAKQFA